MPRDDFDDWLARADGVLDGWRGSDDAMSVRNAPDDADPELPLLGDNSADQTWPLRHRPRQTQSSTRRLVGAVRRWVRR